MRFAELETKINNKFGSWKEFVLKFISYNSLRQRKFKSLKYFLLYQERMSRSKIINYFVEDFKISPIEVFRLINNVKKRNNVKVLNREYLLSYIANNIKKENEVEKLKNKNVEIESKSVKYFYKVKKWEKYQKENRKAYSVVLTNHKTNFIKQYRKVQEEIKEIWQAVKSKDKNNLLEEICDSIVALTKLYYTVNDEKEIQSTMYDVEQKNKERGYYNEEEK